MKLSGSYSYPPNYPSEQAQEHQTAPLPQCDTNAFYYRLRAVFRSALRFSPRTKRILYKE